MSPTVFPHGEEAELNVQTSTCTRGSSIKLSYRTLARRWCSWCRTTGLQGRCRPGCADRRRRRPTSSAGALTRTLWWGCGSLHSWGWRERGRHRHSVNHVGLSAAGKRWQIIQYNLLINSRIMSKKDNLPPQHAYGKLWINLALLISTVLLFAISVWSALPLYSLWAFAQQFW